MVFNLTYSAIRRVFAVKANNYEVSKRLQELLNSLDCLTQEIELLRQENVSDADPGRFMLRLDVIQHLLCKCEDVRGQIRHEKKILFAVENTIIRILKTKAFESISSLEHYLMRHTVTGRRKLLCKFYLNKINLLLNLYEKRKEARDAKRLALYNKLKSLGYYLLDHEELPDTNFSDEEDIYEFKAKDKKTRKFIFSSELRDDGCAYEEPFELVRSTELLIKLRLKLELFKLRRKTKKIYVTRNKLSFKNYTYIPPEIAVPQMDAQGIDVVEDNKAGNVVLTQTRQASSDVATVPRHNWCNYVSSDIVGNYKEMTDRWLKIRTFEWSINDPPNQSVLLSSNEGTSSNRDGIVLPLSVITNDSWSSCDLPNTLPFRVHRYWRGDMEVMIQINSNKFQIGQLQCAWYYQPNADDKFELRTNVFSSSQTSHVLISASESNEAVLSIPFKYHLPMLHTKSRGDMEAPLSMGTLYIRVLTPLTVGANGPQSCNGAVFVRFTNNEFTGQISGAYPQMDTLVKCAEGALSAVLKSPNEDNPPVNAPPRYLVPTASHSWAEGTNIAEPLHMLRLDARGKTAHPDQPPDEQTVSHITSIFGLCALNVKWNKNDRAGKLLYACDASPILDLSKYSQYDDNDVHVLNSYYIPPVAVIASLFNFWRGSIEFRFDVIASAFHTGRLVVGYVPGATNDTQVELKHILAGPHIVFSLQESHQFTYEIPYIANKPFWQRKYMGNYKRDQTLPPSRIYMFVLNPLIPMQSVADNVYINVYMRGGNSFEVSVPVQPSIGCSFNRRVIYSSTEMVYALPGFDPYYAGVWVSFNNSKSLLARYGQTSGYIAKFDKKFLDKTRNYIKDNKPVIRYYYYKIEDTSRGPTYNSAGYLTPVEYGVMCYPTAMDYSYAFMVFVPNEDAAKKCALAVLKALMLNKDTLAACAQYAIVSEGTSTNTYSKDHVGFISIELEYSNNKIELDMADAVASIQGERGSASNVISCSYKFASTGSGMYLYGENFSNLVDLCRRYQIYCSFEIDPSLIKNPGQCSYIIPILPQGLSLNLGTPSAPIELANRCRDGHIPIIASGFRYFRGSIRLRLIVPPNGTIVWLQHRPDRKIRQGIPIRCSEIVTAEAVANHTYGAYVQNTSVNSIIELEVPYYQNSAYGLLQRPKLDGSDRDFYYGLGELSLGFMLAQNDNKSFKNFQCTVYYSFGDDMQLSTFQGFPPVVFLDDIADGASPQMGLWDNFKSKVKDKAREEAVELIKEQTSEIGEHITGKLENFAKQLENRGVTDVAKSSTFRVMVSQFCHIVANFNIKSVCIGVATVLLELGILCLEGMQSCVQAMLKMLYGLRVEPKEPNVGEETNGATESAAPQGDTDDSATIGFLTVLWAGLCSSVSTLTSGKKIFTNLAEFKKFLTVDLTQSFRSANVFFVFLRNIFSVLDAMKVKLLGIIRPDYLKLIKFKGEYESVSAWMSEVLYVSDPKNLETYKYNLSFQNRVNIAYVEGCEFMRQLLVIKDKQVSDSISKFFTKLDKTRSEVVRVGCDGIARREPFVIWQYGEPGIGKSEITTQIICELLEHRKIKSKVAPIYVHDSSKEFWDRCDGNPAMVVDDMFNVQTGDIFERQLALLFTLVTPAVLCPPKARLEDKDKTYNPYIVLFNSNYLFIRPNGVNHDAIHRRRDIILRTKLNPEKKPGCLHCVQNLPTKLAKPEDLADNHHLLFAIQEEVTREVANYKPDWMNYDSMMIKLKQIADIRMDKAEVMFKNRCTSVQRVLDTEALKHEEDRFFTHEQIKAETQKALMDNIEGSYIHALYKALDISKTEVSNMFARMMGYTRKIFPRGKLVITKHIEGEASVADPVPDYCETLRIMREYEEELAQSQGDAWEDFFAKFQERRKNRYQTYAGGSQETDLDYIKKKLTEEATTSFKYNYHEAIDFMEKKIGFNDVVYSELSLAYNEAWFKVCEPYMHIDIGYEAMNAEVYNYIRNAHVTSGKFIMSGTDLYLSLKQILPHCRHPDFLFMWDLQDGEFVTTLGQQQRTLMSLCGDKCKGVCQCERKSWKLKNKNTACDCECHSYAAEHGDVLPAFHQCIVDIPGLLTFYLQLLLKSHPIVNANINSNLKSVQKRIPVYLRTSGLEIIEQTKWQDICENAKDVIERGVAHVCSAFKKLWEFMKKCAPFLGLVLLMGVITGIPLAAQIYGETHCAAQNAPYALNPSTISLNAKVPIAKPEGESQQYDIALTRIKNNFFKIVCKFQDKCITCTGIVLYDRKLLLLRHYLEEFDAVGSCTYYGDFFERPSSHNTLGVEFDLTSCEKKYFKVDKSSKYFDSNFVVVTLPVIFPQCKSLIPLIATSADHENISGTGTLYLSNGRIHESLRLKRENKRLIIHETARSSRIVLNSMYSYQLQGRGLCGSVLLSPNLQRPIIGIHVAGVEIGHVRGISEIICAESFEDIPCAPASFVDKAIIPELSPSEYDTICADVNSMIFKYGTVGPEYTVHQSGRTQYIPSSVHGVFPVDTAPNPLSKGDKRLPPGSSPLVAGISHFGRYPRDFDDSGLAEAAFDLKSVILEHAKPVRLNVGVLSLKDAIIGNPNIKFFEPLEWGTSAGFPLRSEGPAGKRWLFNTEVASDGALVLKGIDPKLLTLLAQDMAHRKRGVKPFTVFVDCLKDTTIPIEKCSIVGKTRIFSISPVQFTIVFKQYFNDFIAAYQTNRLACEHGIGINVQSNEWNALAQHLQAKGDAIVCGDYKNFGPGLMKKAAKAAFQIILDWYDYHGDGENNNIRKVLASEVLDAFHLVGNLIYCTPCGIPSGSPITTPLNSLVNSLYLRYAWKMITNLDFVVMREHCHIVTYGDDVCINVSDDFKNVYNTRSLSDAFAQYNIVFTDIDKSGEIIPYRNIRTASFLKHEFFFNSVFGIYMAALDKRSIQGCVNWISRKGNQVENTVVNCETAIRLAHGWGPEYYQYIIDNILKACDTASIRHPTYYSWLELCRKFYE